ncbi:MAG: LysE family translocator [Thermodesulfobacteriota bacterium]
MDLTILAKGLLIGLAIAAPVGPIGALCIQRTLTSGRMMGFVSGLGAAVADAIYGSVAAFGLTSISLFLTERQTWFRVIGGLFLLYLGIKAFFSAPTLNAEAADIKKGASVFASTFFLTLTNPATIIMFAAVFAGYGALGISAGFLSAGLLVLGVFLGSASWWFFLSGVVSLVRGRMKEKHYRWTNRLAGVVIAGLGVLSLASLRL